MGTCGRDLAQRVSGMNGKGSLASKAATASTASYQSDSNVISLDVGLSYHRCSALKLQSTKIVIQLVS